MKGIGTHFAQQGEDVDLLWCSSDPDSLDGVVLKQRRIALVDGTAPHIMDPKNPGAVDKILHVGEYWAEEGLRAHREEILSCNEKTAAMFQLVYGYLASAGIRAQFLAELLQKMVGEAGIFETRRALQRKLGTILTVRRMEAKRNRDCAMGSGQVPGHCKRAFAGAITPDGIKNELPSLISGLEKVILLRCPQGFAVQQILEPVKQRLLDAGFDLETYYCPMDPEHKLEHILVPDAGFAVVSCNRYHDVKGDRSTQKFMEISMEENPAHDAFRQEIRQDLTEGIERDLQKALELLRETRKVHDELESYYIPCMDFDKIEQVQKQVIAEIEHRN